MGNGLLTKSADWVRSVWKRERTAIDALADNLELKIPHTVRQVVERFEHAALDSKADREALIKALVEALT